MRGQTLVEVIIAIAIGTVLLVGGVSLLAPAVRINTQAGRVATASSLAKGLSDNVTAWAGGDWSGLTALATTSAHTYYLLTATSPFVATSGVESITVSSTTFTRYFYVDDIYRDTGGNATTTASGNTLDPSTKEITVAAGWAGGTTTTIVAYLTRHGENAYSQSDWSGGSGTAGPVTVVGNTFTSESNIDYSTTPGAVTLLISAGTGGISSSTYAHWAWNDLIGWIDMYNGGSVTVDSSQLTGYASSSAGAISFDCATSPSGNICGTSPYVVDNNSSGTLSGWAWNDVYGWISFSSSTGGSGNYDVSIDASGTWSGFAWNDVAGWFSFNCADSGGCTSSTYNTAGSWTPTSNITGTLESAIFDTGVASGAQLNSFTWTGAQPSGTTVEFQFAVSDNAGGPWTFTGSDGGTNSYWTTLGSGQPKSFGSAYNGRYFRYLLTLIGPNTTTTLKVTSVSVSWSP